MQVFAEPAAWFKVEHSFMFGFVIYYLHHTVLKKQ